MLSDFLKEYSSESIAVLDTAISLSDYEPLDLSVQNRELDGYAMTTPEGCQSYIDIILGKAGKKNCIWRLFRAKGHI